MIHCPLCQYKFDDKNTCKGCGISQGCTLIKCPNCSYEFVEESKTLSYLTRLFERLKKKKGEPNERAD